MVVSLKYEIINLVSIKVVKLMIECDVLFFSVNKYELICLENQGKNGYQSPERILLAFKVLDELVPKLGVYSRVLGKIKDDLNGRLYKFIQIH